MKVLICPEDQTQIKITRENLLDKLPPDVREKVVWRDRFWLPDRELDETIFTVSDMVVEVRDLPTGRIFAFNGTTEWALDSVAVADAVWLPREDQLRELLRGTFRSLTSCAIPLPLTIRMSVATIG